MKKYLIILIFLIGTLSVYGQGFVNFVPIEKNTGSTNYSNTNTCSHKKSTIGYILDENGYIKKKINLKVSVESTKFSETVKIVSYYNVVQGFSANWVDVSVLAQPIGAQIPMNKRQKVAYANFMYWAYWNIDIIWFN